MPGVKSLEAQQYYAHPRNAFWPIMAELFTVTWSSDYQQRVAQLQQLPVMLWDVLKQCQREGSLDSDIEADNLEANAIAQLLNEQTSVRVIAFNGGAAETLFKRHVAKSISNLSDFNLMRLPSTSPAHASMNLQQKLQAWRELESYLKGIATFRRKAFHCAEIVIEYAPARIPLTKITF